MFSSGSAPKRTSKKGKGPKQITKSPEEIVIARQDEDTQKLIEQTSAETEERYLESRDGIFRQREGFNERVINFLAEKRVQDILQPQTQEEARPGVRVYDPIHPREPSHLLEARALNLAWFISTLKTQPIVLTGMGYIAWAMANLCYGNITVEGSFACMAAARTGNPSIIPIFALIEISEDKRLKKMKKAFQRLLGSASERALNWLRDPSDRLTSATEAAYELRSLTSEVNKILGDVITFGITPPDLGDDLSVSDLMELYEPFNSDALNQLPIQIIYFPKEDEQSAARDWINQHHSLRSLMTDLDVENHQGVSWNFLEVRAIITREQANQSGYIVPATATLRLKTLSEDLPRPSSPVYSDQLRGQECENSEHSEKGEESKYPDDLTMTIHEGLSPKDVCMRTIQFLNQSMPIAGHFLESQAMGSEMEDLSDFMQALSGAFKSVWALAYVSGEKHVPRETFYNPVTGPLDLIAPEEKLSAPEPSPLAQTQKPLLMKLPQNTEVEDKRWEEKLQELVKSIQTLEDAITYVTNQTRLVVDPFGAHFWDTNDGEAAGVYTNFLKTGAPDIIKQCAFGAPLVSRQDMEAFLTALPDLIKECASLPDQLFHTVTRVWEAYQGAYWYLIYKMPVNPYRSVIAACLIASAEPKRYVGIGEGLKWGKQYKAYWKEMIAQLYDLVTPQ